MTCSLRPALLSLALLSACGPSTTAPPPDAEGDTPAVVDVSPDVSPDVAIDVAPDTAPDVAIDARPDVAADAAPDVIVDASFDAPPAPDVVVDVATLDRPVTPDAQPDVPTTGAVCGTRGAPPCGAGLYCNFPLSAICGAADGPGRCDVIPSICTRELNPVCGCDGRDYSNPCVAASMGVSVARMGMCASPDGGRPDVPDVSTCGAQDAMGVGACARFFGYAWNGSSCAGISGCSCAGAACMSLYESVEACRAAYPSCDCRTVGCSSTSTCQACRGVGGIVYACIPRGAAC